jgi:hypothetical protein
MLVEGGFVVMLGAAQKDYRAEQIISKDDKAH